METFYPLPAVPYLKLSAVHDDKAGTLTLFALNRHLNDDMTVDFTTKGFGKLAVQGASVMTRFEGPQHLKKPDRIQPLPLRDIKIREGGVSATLRPASWNVFQLKVGNDSSILLTRRHRLGGEWRHRADAAMAHTHIAIDVCYGPWP